MKIGLIGAGKVGVSLGKFFTEHGLSVSGFYSKTLESAQQAAEYTNTIRYDAMKQIVEASDVLFFTVPDGQIASVWNEVKSCDIVGKFIIHTSGLFTSAIFSDINETGAFGYSIHPFLAISSKYDSTEALSNCLFTVEGDAKHVNEVFAFMHQCTEHVQMISTEDKAKYHAAASIASNFMVTLADWSMSLLKECNFSDENAITALKPLMIGNLMSVIEKGPTEALTGPIERNDQTTVEAHMKAIHENDLELYRALAVKTISVAKRKHPGRDYQVMEEMLL